ncbi:hypothetical protein D3C77_749740 [compost metagenome]
MILAAVARKVIKAASRLSTSFMALARLPAIVPNKASPANVLINVAGNVANIVANVTPKIPTKI